ncbi:MAG TPA: type II toxin-antitoxin system VapC family toxin [Vicinamibacterales bacterium]|nr:type II toxin-antitoxin system VapC family toxin [Vicinamibacterales bacterium]
MIVLDASAILELLLGTPAGLEVGARLADPAMALHVPHLIDLEVAQVLRRYVRDAQLTEKDAVNALQDLRDLDLTRHAHEPLLGRVWALRQNFSVYDAVYVALSEVLDASLVTCDRRLAHAPGMKKRAILI